MRGGTSKYGVPRVLPNGRDNPDYSRAWRLAHRQYPKDYYVANRARILMQTKAWRQAHPAAKRKVSWRGQGINNLELAEAMWERARACGICGGNFAGDPRAGLAKVLDHDPATGEPRGVIHRRCNIGLGIFSSPELLNMAAHYLRGEAQS